MAEKRVIDEAHVQESSSYRCMISMLETLIEEMKCEKPSPRDIASLVRCAYDFQKNIFIDSEGLFPCECGCVVE